MSDLPPGWECSTLQDLAAPEPRAMTDGPFGSNLKSAHYVDSGPRVIRLQNIGFGEFVDEKAHITESHFETLRAHEARCGDLVVASLGQDLPRACLVPPNLGPAIVKADCIRVRLHPGLDARYVNYALQRPDLRHAVAEQIHGVGRPRLGMAGIKELSIPLPPRAEQERIVAAIEEHISRLDAADSASRSCRRRLGVLRQRLTDVAVNGAPAVPLGDLLREPLRNGLSARASAHGSIRVVTLTAVTKSAFVEDYTKLIESGLRTVDDLWMHPGDVFIQRSNTPELVGTAALFDGPAAWAIFPDLLIRVRVDRDRIEPEYLTLVLKSTGLRRYFQRSAQGIAGSMPKISQPVVASAPIPLPPIETQREILGRVVGEFATVGRLAREVDVAARRIVSLRRSILAAAFSGQLVPQDPNDEPASVLLDRIRAERAAAAPVRPSRKAATT